MMSLAEWRVIRTKAHCDECRRKQAMWTDGDRVLCGFCCPKEGRYQSASLLGRAIEGGTR